MSASLSAPMLLRVKATVRVGRDPATRSGSLLGLLQGAGLAQFFGGAVGVQDDRFAVLVDCAAVQDGSQGGLLAGFQALADGADGVDLAKPAGLSEGFGLEPTRIAHPVIHPRALNKVGYL